MEAILRLIIGLGVLVFIHELGHFLLAKLVGIRVERFSLGFPPRMFGKKVGDTDYCISWIPLGGYVKMSGMIDETMEQDAIKGESWEFMSKPVYQRFLVIFAGPAMNIILAMFMFGAIAYVIGLKEPLGLAVGKIKSEIVITETGLQHGDMIVAVENQPVKTWFELEPLKKESGSINLTIERDGNIQNVSFASAFIDSIEKNLPAIVGNLQDDFPAKEVGLQAGDRIVAIDSLQVRTWSDLTDIIYNSAEKTIVIEWERGGQHFSSEIIPKKQKGQNKDYGLIGISYPVIEKELNPWQACKHGVVKSWEITQLIGKSINMIFSGEQPFKDAFAGPIMIAKIAKESAKDGEANFLAFVAFLSLNLGLLNLLPIPVLDGGHIIFLIIEGIIRRPISPKVKLVIQQVGMVILLAFMLFVIVNDIKRIWP